ncbi:MAG: hypothetical protein JXL97_09330 [Bacteroidales bacterium]|nr:hypothetical protein [Bacteroidales bacterium]
MMKDKFDILRYLKNQIFAQIEPPTEYERRLREVIKNKTKQGYIKAIQFFVIMVMVALMTRFTTPLMILIIIGVFVSILRVLNIFKGKYKRASHLIIEAIDFIKKSQFNAALDKMIDAYKITKDKDLLQIIIDFANDYPPNAQQDILIMEITFGNEKKTNIKDKKLQEILNQLSSISKYILKHKEVVVSVLKKINDLKMNLAGTKDERIRKEYSVLIKRYDDIIELENSKINFYEKTKDELLKLKENHVITQKLLLEKEELRNLEDRLLEKSIKETYDTDINDFLSYETAYLEAIKEYSEQISSTGDQNLFQDIITSFNDRTELL